MLSHGSPYPLCTFMIKTLPVLAKLSHRNPTFNFEVSFQRILSWIWPCGAVPVFCVGGKNCGQARTRSRFKRLIQSAKTKQSVVDFACPCVSSGAHTHALTRSCLLSERSSASAVSVTPLVLTNVTAALDNGPNALAVGSVVCASV